MTTVRVSSSPATIFNRPTRSSGSGSRLGGDTAGLDEEPDVKEVHTDKQKKAFRALPGHLGHAIQAQDTLS
jgi:hypothetical protein